MRQVVAALGAVALALVAGVGSGHRTPAPQATGTPVLVAVRDLAVGALPTPADVALTLLPKAAIPEDALRSRSLPRAPVALPLHRGDVLTWRHLGAAVLSLPGLRTFALDVGTGVQTGPVTPGELVDVIAATTRGASTVVEGAPVVRLVPGSPGRAAQVVLGVTARGAERLAAARAAASITLVGRSEADAGSP